MTVDQAFQIGLANQAAGQPAQAEAIFRQIVAQHPQHADSWHRLGAIALTTGRVHEAIDLISRAIACCSTNAAFYADLGVGFFSLRRVEEAAASFRRALALQPNVAHVHSNLGDALDALGRPAEAIASYRRAIELQPTYAGAHNNLANVLARQGQVDAAIAHFRQALAIQPDFIEALCNLGDNLSKIGQAEEAIACLRHAVTIRPNFSPAHNLLGTALWRHRRWEEAIVCLRRAIELQPNFAEAHHNLGSALLELDRMDEAIASYQRTLALDPSFADAHGNLGVALMREGHFEESLRSFRRAIALRPNFADAHWNLSLLLLLLGQYEEGWREHEWRWRTPTPVAPIRNFPAPLWDGSPVPGKTLLLHVEQGYGDAIQFLRYLPLARERSQAGRIILECPAPLMRLFSNLEGVEVVARQSWDATGLPPFDCHLPLLSLPLMLREYAPLRIDGAYLHADPTLRAQWRERIGAPGSFRVGLAWAGKPEHKNDRNRSIAFERLRPLLNVPGVVFYSLQVEPRAPLDAGLIDLTAHIVDFADSAALVAELDLIISVDTAVAHLAGALGRPVWLLLPFVPDWRWGLQHGETPWYVTMRVFRQPKRGAWDAVVETVAAELRRHAISC